MWYNQSQKNKTYWVNNMYLTAMDELAECIETCQGCHITC